MALPVGRVGQCFTAGEGGSTSAETGVCTFMCVCVYLCMSLCAVYIFLSSSLVQCCMYVCR